MNIVLLSCASKKLCNKSRAEDLYISDLFKKCLKYARSLEPDRIYILSTRYGLLDLDEEIYPYDETLNKMPISEVRKWASRVISQLEEKVDLQNDEFIFLAGEKYRKYLLPHIKNYKIPMKNLCIGKQLRWLKNAL